MNKENNSKKKIKDFFEIPKEIISNEPKLTIMGFSEMLIENYKGILEYEDFFIRINTQIGTINVNGFNLELIQMTENDVIVTGKIQSIDIEENLR